MKCPYPLVMACDTYKRHSQMAIALQYGWPRLKQVPIDERKSLTIACYGPSLADTYKDMKRPIMSMSGATQWLADHGVVPDYHVAMDPRADNVPYVVPPIHGVHYLIATVCHPSMWKALLGHEPVTLWHTYSGEETYDWVKSMDPDQLVIRGGSTIGLTALHLGGIMGYRHFEVHGMDGSFKSLDRKERHAGVHYGHKQNKDGITWAAGGKNYATSKIMANAVAETLNAMSLYPMFCVFHGDGLTQALIREKNFQNACCADETEKADRIRKATATIQDMLLLTPEKAKLSVTQVWDQMYGPSIDGVEESMQALSGANQTLRAKADYNTGSVTVSQMVQLRRISNHIKPKTVVEVGTFIGNSAMALQAEKIYTCDRSNDCLPPSDVINVYPKTDSTTMFSDLVAKGVKADVFFFDGRLHPQEMGMVLELSRPGAWYIFDDYKDNNKGVVNARIMAACLPKDYVLIEPDPRVADSTLAAMLPLQSLTV